MNRLLTAQRQSKTTATSGAPCWGQSYVYDRYANLSAINVPGTHSGCYNGPALSLSINATNNKITNANFSYDAAGNLTASPVGYSYTWNAEGRMATAVAGGVTYTYTYTYTYTHNGPSSSEAQRVKKAAASSSSFDKLYWYGLGGEVLAESALDGTLTSEYIFMGATRIARRDVSSGNVYYFLGDRLGNARIVTNSTGGIVEESDFLPYGTERTITDSLDNNYKFTGHERDGESGLDHTLYRQHSNTLGRWLSADPARGRVADPQTWNRYSYGGNSPCDNVDPSGGFYVTPPYPGQPRFPRRGGNPYDAGFGFDPNPFKINRKTYYDDNYNRLDKKDKEDLLLDLADEVKEWLSANMTDDCAKSIGAGSKEDVTAAFQATRVVTGPLGPVVIGQNLSYGQFLNSDGGSPTIVLNPNVNWSNPDYTPAINTDGTAATGNVATSFSDYLGISGTSINPQQFMGMVLLHELGHNFPGERHPGDTPQSYEDYDRGILAAC